MDKKHSWALILPMIITLSSCAGGDSEKDLSEQAQALEKIANYAGGTSAPLTIQDYSKAGISGINASNLGAINKKIVNLSYSEVDSIEEIQSLSDDLDAKTSDSSDTTTDKTQPAITLKGNSTVNILLGSDYVDAGATASDNQDGDITNNIVVVNPVVTDTAGIYQLTYNVVDAAGNHAAQITRTVVVSPPDRAYGLEGSHAVAKPWKEPTENKSVVYYPANISSDNPTPVIFFAPGWKHTNDTKSVEDNEAGYESILRFIASHGYSVIFARDDKGGTSAEHFIEYFKTMAKHPDVAPYIDTSRIGVMGFSSGGGHAFNILKRLKSDEGWGENGRFVFAMEPWFAFDMTKTEMETLPANTNTVFIQFGEGGNNDDPKYGSQDPRIPLTEFYLLKSIADNKKDYQIVTNATHSYPEGDRAYADMQGILKPLDALMEVTFKDPENSVAHQFALEVGNDDPYANGEGIQELNDKKSYDFKCSDQTFETIDYCAIGSEANKYPPETAFTSIATNRSVEKPSLLGAITDPEFGSTVTRMTNRANENGNDLLYPKTPSWNSDMSLLRLRYRLYDADTLAESPITSGTGNNSALYSLNGAVSEMKWSNTDPNVYYGISSHYGFVKATINGNQISTEILGTFPAADYEEFTLGKYEGNIDHNDRYVAFAARKTGKSYLTVIVFDIQAKTVIASKDFTKIDWLDANDKQVLDWVSVSPSGTSVLINWKDKPKNTNGNAQSSIHQYDINLNHIRRLANQGQHGDIGVDADGKDVLVQFEFGGDDVGIWSYRLSDGKRTRLLPSKYNGGHVSCRNTKRPGWCYVSATQEGHREVFAVKLDGSEMVNRFVQTRTSDAKNSQGGVSPDGTRIVFDSDWGVDGATRETYHVQ